MKLARFGAIFLTGIYTGTASLAAENREARVTQVVQDVQLLFSQAVPRRASVNDKVADGTAVRTGGNSRAELTFADLTLTRVGAKSVFSFHQGGRNLEVDNGAILLRIPKNSGGARIRSDTISVSVTGTTLLFESRPRNYSKLILLEGSARVSLRSHPAESVVVRAGQMLVVQSGAARLPRPVEIDLDRVMKTATLITAFPPLPSMRLILAAIKDQGQSGAQLLNPDFAPTGLDARDVVAAIRSQPTPSRPKSGKAPPDFRKP
jgi:hypothetical protein